MCKKKEIKPRKKAPCKELADDFFKIIDKKKTWDKKTDMLVEKHFKKNPLAVVMMAMGIPRTDEIKEKLKNLFSEMESKFPKQATCLPIISE